MVYQTRSGFTYIHLSLLRRSRVGTLLGPRSSDLLGVGSVPSTSHVHDPWIRAHAALDLHAARSGPIVARWAIRRPSVLRDRAVHMHPAEPVRLPLLTTTLQLGCLPRTWAAENAGNESRKPISLPLVITLGQALS